MNNTSTLYKKVFGCVIGGAIGDAFGGPVETMSADFIRQQHNGLVTELIDYTGRPADFFQPEVNSAYTWSSAAGSHTDDTYFALVNGRCIVEKGGRISCDDLAEYWMEKLDITRGWASVQNAYSNLLYTSRPCRDVSRGNIADNSSAMCIGPVGIINACDPAQAALDAYDVTTLLHDDHSRDAAGIIAAAVAEAMRPSATVDSIVQAALDNIPNREYSVMHKPMHLAVELARKAADTEELTKLYYQQLNMDWDCRKKNLKDGRHSDSVEPYESIPCAVGMFLNAGGDYEKTILGSANYGRDCDTIACMAGYIAGAYNGADAIPEAWIKTVLEANPDAHFEELAAQLTDTLLAQAAKVAHRCETIAAMA